MPHRSFDRLERLLRVYGYIDLESFEFVEPGSMPEPYGMLLNHETHMTITLERHYDSELRVRPYRELRTAHHYARRLDLLLKDRDVVVLTGAVVIDLDAITDSAREALTATSIPLGRILADSGSVLRVELAGLLRLGAGHELVERFGVPDAKPTYGRLARMYVDNRDAIELLEIVSPVA